MRLPLKGIIYTFILAFPGFANLFYRIMAALCWTAGKKGNIKSSTHLT